MRKIREVLRLKAEGFSDRQIAKAIGSARSTVQECLRRAREAQLAWPLPADVDEAVLQEKLYRREVPLSRTPQPDFAELHRELRRPGVTRMLLWEEYKARHPDGWQYSVFCDQYRRWLTRQELVLRREHAPGEKLFVDYAGETVSILDRYSGECREAQIFVAVLGCSNLTYAEPTWTQALPDWLASHVRTLEYLGGVPRAIVPDNLKSGVMAPNLAVATGRDAIRAMIAKQSADAKAAGLKLAINQAAMGVAGDLAWHSGSYTINAADGAAVDGGGYLEVSKNVSGQWMILLDAWNSDAPAPVAPGKVLRVVRFTSASADAQQAVMKLADEEMTPLYSSSKGFPWVKYFTDLKTLATGSVTAWDSAADVEAFVKADGYQGIPAKLEPLMKGAMASDVYAVNTPAK